MNAAAVRQLAAMKYNPGQGWSIEQVEELCRGFSVHPYVPPGGRHCVLSHPSIEGLLTVPADRPIKPLYVQLVVDMVESLTETQE